MMDHIHGVVLCAASLTTDHPGKIEFKLVARTQKICSDSLACFRLSTHPKSFTHAGNQHIDEHNCDG
jgi:hypothetical protein